MAYLWMTGAVFYYYRYERPPKSHRDLPDAGPETPPPLAEYPLVTIIVPCHNEGRDIEDTVEYLLASTYPNFDILLVDDGSADETRSILDGIAALHPVVRVIHCAHNQGKAVALTTASLMTPAQYLCCIDADALLDPEALSWLMVHFLNPRVGAVTGNPRVRNRSTLLGRLQVGEFSSIVGLIKRAQRTYGRIFTVSGVVACFRKAALHDVGYWSMWPVLLEYLMSVVWAYAMLVMAVLWVAGKFIELPPDYSVPSLLSGWSGVMVGTTCLIQIGVSLALDSRYGGGSVRSFFWMIWYPLAYWMINMATTIVAVPRALLRNSEKRARWTSPDRGILP